jgi:hypothetical protein
MKKTLVLCLVAFVMAVSLVVSCNVAPKLSKAEAITPLTNPQLIENLKPVVNGSVNKLDIFAKSSGAVPDASNIITVAIPDGAGYTFRSRAAAYLDGTSQFILSDATAYGGAGSGVDRIKLHIYAIWDANGGIVWALNRFSGFLQVPTTTTIGDDDYFLLEAGSTYTRAATDHCVCVGHVWVNYNTANNPDWTILNTPADLMPIVEWSTKSDYEAFVWFPLSNVSAASDIAEYSAMSVVAKQGGRYISMVNVMGRCDGNVVVYLKWGSATYASAGYAWSMIQTPVSDGYATLSRTTEIVVNKGDTIHVGVAVTGTSVNRIIYGDDSFPHATGFKIQRVD